MNPIIAFEQGYIPFSDLKKHLWDMGPNSILAVGEKCFVFYCDRANGFHNNDFYILKYGSGLDGDEEWYCD